MQKNIVVLGSGAWGTALAKHCHSIGHTVTLWCRRQSLCDNINTHHTNCENLKGIDLKGIIATSDIAVTQNSDMVLVVTPSQHMRSVLENVKISESTPLILCCKGIEVESLKLLSDIAQDMFPKNPIMALSGPTFAIEVAQGLPTAVTLAGDINNTILQNTVQDISSPNFRIYSTTDITGAEIGGAVKNVLAIACGIINGKNLGDNARASLITRGIAEISRLCQALGGKQETLLGLCGIGDLFLTCSSMQSRNMSFGYDLGIGKTIQEVLSERKTVTEGAINCKSVMALAQKLNIEMPICNAINNIMNESLTVDEAIESLLSRPLKNT